SLPLGPVIAENIKEVDRATRFQFSWSNFKREDDLFEANLSYVDPDFFEMFTFEFVAGDGKAIRDVSSVVINEEMATKLFGDAQTAYGKTITQVFGTQLKEVKIAGVFKRPPMNSSFYQRQAYLNFENCKDEHPETTDDNWRQESSIYIEISNPSSVASVHEQLQKYIENNNQVREDLLINEYALDHLPTMATNDMTQHIPNWTWNAPPPAAIVGSAATGILILLIACFNLTNTAIAISSRRLKEIGIRKVMGGMRKQL